ncbi:MAG: hypothetical protein IKR23_04580, partial [Lachnospiraceae bacterium]|nr:hypothetical protein [Lachnospiraceae bacterium]
PDNGTEPVPVENGTSGIVLTKVEPISLPEMNVTVDMAYTQNTTYTDCKYKAADVKTGSDNIYTVGAVSIQFNSSLLKYAVPQFKFKNAKHSTAVTGKKASVTVKLKAKKGIDRGIKGQINAANKELKRHPMEFTLEQVDLAQAKDVTYETDKKGAKVKKVSLTANGFKYNLKAKKNFIYEMGTDSITIQGTGDYKNTYKIPVKAK